MGTRDVIALGVAAAAAGAILVVGPAAHAAANRAWVSGKGIDRAGCGAPTDPCRSLQYAHDNAVVAGGEIDILDPAGYGPVTINKAISIVNDGVGTAGVQATSGSAITILAGATDAIYLRGLNIDGVQFTGETGINFALGGALTISNCVVRHFAGNGLLMEPPSGAIKLVVSDTIVSDNGADGVFYDSLATETASISGVFDNVTADNNASDGFDLENHGTGATAFTLEDSNANNNNGFGVEVDTGSNEQVFVSTTHMNYNNTGLFASGTAQVRIWDDSAVGNATDGTQTSFSSGEMITMGGNVIRDNGNNNIAGALTPDTTN